MEELPLVSDEEILEMSISNVKEVSDGAVPSTGEAVVLHDDVGDSGRVLSNESFCEFSMPILLHQLLVDRAFWIVQFFNVVLESLFILRLDDRLQDGGSRDKLNEPFDLVTCHSFVGCQLHVNVDILQELVH